MKRSSSALGSLLVCAGVALGACADSVETPVATEATPPPPESVVTPDSGRPPAEVDGGSDGVVGEQPAPICGDGKIGQGEACDDGNTSDNDGCSSKCAIESTSQADVCPGVALALAPVPGEPQLLRASVTGSTSGAYNHFGSACGGGSGRDLVYAITPPSSGKAIVRLSASFSAIVSARATCTDAKSETKCEGIQTQGGEVTMEVPTFAGTPTFLFVDGYGGTHGDFTLDVDVSTASCGNGLAELPEECDDGNTTGGDGCSATCTLETGGVIDNCPGQPFILSGQPGAERKISFAGNTLTQGGRTQQSSGCFYWNGSNTVYAVKSDIDGAAKAKLNAAYSRSNLHVRSDCGSNSYQLGCTQQEAPGEIELEFPVTAGDWFYLFVEGDFSSSTDYAGPYSLDLTVTPAACGNGVLDGREECDDGNTQSGDGCSAACALEAVPAANACPGQAIPLSVRPDGTRAATIAGSTAGGTSSFPACGLASGSAPEVVYSITPDIDGLLSGDLRGPFNSVLFVRSTCSDEATELDCSYKANASVTPFILTGLGSVPKHIEAPVRAGTTYYVIVDSANSSGTPATGSFKLDLSVAPAVCGNGKIEGAEQCDDGGTADEDGCSSTCQLETQGPKTCATAETIQLQPSGQPGGYTATLARGTTGYNASHDFTTSTTAACYAPGQEAYFAVTAPESGVLRAEVTSSAFDAVLGFRSPCATSGNPLLCANDAPKGSVESLTTPVTAGQTLYIVVDSAAAGASGTFTLHVTLTPSGCGDGFFVPGPDEDCDDGNHTNGDGCNATCRLEPLTGIDVCPGREITLTGSGTQQRKGVITLDTTSLNANYTGVCGGNAREGVVKVVSPINGLLRARARGMNGVTTYARTVCADPTTEIKKVSSTTCFNVVHDTLTFSVLEGTEYFIFVDGLEGATGVPTLEVTIDP